MCDGGGCASLDEGDNATHSPTPPKVLPQQWAASTLSMWQQRSSDGWWWLCTHVAARPTAMELGLPWRAKKIDVQGIERSHEREKPA